MTEKFECVVSADLFRRALFAVGTDETRYYLQGVHVSPAPEGGAVLVGTDGSMILAFHDPLAQIEGSGIVRLEKAAQQALSAKGILLEQRLLAVRTAACVGRAMVVDVPAARNEDDALQPYAAALDRLDEPDGRVRAAQFGPVCIDGEYPDWRRVIPDAADLAPGAAVGAFDEQRLARLAKALCSSREATLRLTPHKDGEAAPILVTATRPAAPSGFGLLMGVRSDGLAQAKVPTWALRPQSIAA